MEFTSSKYMITHLLMYQNDGMFCVTDLADLVNNCLSTEMVKHDYFNKTDFPVIVTEMSR